MAKDTDERAVPDQGEAMSLDMSQAAVKKMIAEAREKGYVTYDQLNAVLPPEQVSSEQIEDVMSMLSEMGINVIEDEEAEEEQKANTAVAVKETGGAVAAAGAQTEKLDRTDDPRFQLTAEELEKQGIEDFQLDYAVRTLRRTGAANVARK